MVSERRVSVVNSLLAAALSCSCLLAVSAVGSRQPCVTASIWIMNGISRCHWPGLQCEAQGSCRQLAMSRSVLCRPPLW